MTRTMFAMAVAGLILAAVSGTSQAAPIAPLSAVSASQQGNLTQVYWRGHGYRGWCYWHPRRCRR
jgi:hypothetical protein